jgi:hypothetical protein
MAAKEEKKSGKKSKKSKAADGKDAELELLMLDENDEFAGSKHRHFDMDEIVKDSKKSKKKSKSNDAAAAAEHDTFDVDVQDDRFKALFSSSDFAIDPTSSKFKKTKAMDKIMHERQKRHIDDADGPQAVAASKQDKKSDLMALVNKIKRKTVDENISIGKRKKAKK